MPDKTWSEGSGNSPDLKTGGIRLVLDWKTNSYITQFSFLQNLFILFNNIETYCIEPEPLQGAS